MNDANAGVAIIGMACRFPGAVDLASFRSNLENGVDAITEVPTGRWDPVFFDPASDAADRIYCRRGGFLGDSISFDPLAYGIMPIAAEGAEPDQMLALALVTAALHDAGLDAENALPREKTAVILGRGGYPGIRTVAGIQHTRTAQQLVEALRALVPGVSEEQLAAVKKEFVAQLGPYGADTAIGLVPNIAASRIANRFDLHGPAYTVDAACASSLIAVDHGVEQLLSRRSDLIIAGGVHLCDDLGFWNIFSRLGALSRAQMSRPFDRRADGLLIGEGVGVFILKRLADAQRDGDRVYAIIRGTGVASDGRERSLMLPSVRGQVLALERAWKSTGLDPGTIGLLEAHGTGTPNGDRAELLTISSFFGRHLHHAPGLGSVKSMIGHTMPAAGAAGLIKAALALYHRFLPPTINCEEPNELVGQSGFRLIHEREPWDGRRVPFRAGVNAFGFGGINAHVVLEGADSDCCEGQSAFMPIRSSRWADMYLAEADSAAALDEALRSGHGGHPNGKHRIVIDSPTPERRELAREVIRRGKRWAGRNGIWYSPDGLSGQGGRIAFLYPGVHGGFSTRINDVASYFGRELPLYHDASEGLVAISTGIVELGRWLTDVLKELGIEPEALAGHSIGEWTGMIISGITSGEESDRFVKEMVPVLRLEVPGVYFAAVGCGVEKGNRAISGLERIAVSHDNCPHQIILCGVEASIDEALARLHREGVMGEKLPFRSGFHSALFQPYLQPLQETFEHFRFDAAQVPMWSATNVDLYPGEHDAIRDLCLRHLVEPVQFRSLTERLYEEGFRVFIQVGVGPLAGFVEDTLKGKAHAAISAHVERRTGLDQLRRLVAELWCEGYNVKLNKVGLRIVSQLQEATAGSALRLPLGTPLARFGTALSLASDSRLQLPAAPGPESGPILSAFAQAQVDLATMSAEVLDAWRRRSTPRPAGGKQSAKALQPRSSIFKRRYSLAEMPELIDHSFAEQPPGWQFPRDSFPVVPMTRSLGTLLEIARELVPELVPVGIERVRALRWIEVEPPVELEVTAAFDGVERVQVDLGDRLSGVVLMASSYDTAPKPLPLEPGPTEVPWIDAERFYNDPTVFMFHGPCYQSVTALGPMGARGLRGEIQCLPAPGALLDAAGQLLGYWAAAHVTDNRVVLPFRVDRIRFFADHPSPGTRLICDVRIKELTDVWVRGDLDIHDGERVWAQITGWEDRRFESDQRMHEVFTVPATNAFAQLRPEGYCLAVEKWRSTASRYFVARRYLDGAGMEEYAAKGIRAQRAWLLGRIAVKDAVRQLLWAQGHGPLYPIEVQVENGPQGRPFVRGPWSYDLRVSVAHKETKAVALVAEGTDVGIDIERIETRSDEFLRLAFSNQELDLLPNENRDEWVTRLWVAKEAVAKARGTGLGGDARVLSLSAIDGERLLVDGKWVKTCREEDHIVGWTENESIWRAPTSPVSL